MAGATLAASMTHAELRSFVLVLAASTGAAFLSRLAPQALLPTVVVEIVLGILIGPEVLGWASADQHIAFLSNLGLAALFFFAGVEVIGEHVPPSVIQRGTVGWCLSLVIGILVGYLLVYLGLDAEGWLVGVAISTTALGTLIPILADAGLLPTPLGIATLGTGVAGEFWPIVVISVFLTGVYGAVHEVLLLLAFGAIALGAGYAALRVRPPRVLGILRDTLHSSGQAAVRLSILVLAALVLLAYDVGFDFVLGAFAAGLVVGLVLDNPQGRVVRLRLEGIGFGFLIPIYFVATGLTFDINSLLTVHGLALAGLFLACFLVVRSASALLWLRELGRRPTTSLALFGATELPLVVAIVSIGTDRGAITSGIGASLIGAAMISVLLYPLLACALAGEPNLSTNAPPVVPDEAAEY